jgi:pimeloyl-ACP methyl ester carboxylesterase
MGKYYMRKIIFSTFVIGLLTSFALLVQSVPSTAAVQRESSTPVPSQLISIPMADGLEIKGDFYTAPEGELAPAALLLHQNNGSGVGWIPFAVPLAAQGYNVLAIDMRGHGLTGGRRNWGLAESDAAALMDWLREQPTVDPDRVAIVGASIGANLALRVCSEDADCHAAIALSPGLNYFGISTRTAVEAMEDKSILLVASQLDAQSGDATKSLTSFTPSSVNVLTRIYGSVPSHGVAMFGQDDLIPLMLGWLDMYNE